MPDKSSTRTLMNTQRLKETEKLHNSERHYFCHIFWSLWKKINSKNFDVVSSEILKLFVNILTPDDKYSLSVKASV